MDGTPIEDTRGEIAAELQDASELLMRAAQALAGAADRLAALPTLDADRDPGTVPTLPDQRQDFARLLRARDRVSELQAKRQGAVSRAAHADAAADGARHTAAEAVTHLALIHQRQPDGVEDPDLERELVRASRLAEEAEKAARRSELERDHSRAEIQQAEAALAEAVADREQLEAELVTHDDPDTPLRELVLRALAELEAPASSAVLADYLRIRFGRTIATNRLGTLRRDEERAYVTAIRRGAKARVWLVPALFRDGGADRTLWTRSDWELGRRCADNEPELRLLYHLAHLGGAPPRGCYDPVGLFDFALDAVGLHDMGIGAPTERLEVAADNIYNDLAPTAAPGEWDQHAVSPTRPATPGELERFAAAADEHARLFGVNHDLTQPTTE